MKLVKVIGIGSPFGDDQAGIKVAEILKNELSEINKKKLSIQVEILDRPGLKLLESISHAETVFIVDAVKTGNKIGSIYHLNNYEMIESNLFLSTHGIGIKEVLNLGKILKFLPKKIFFLGIEINKISFDCTISKEVNQAIYKTVEIIKKKLKIHSKHRPQDLAQ